MKKIPALLAALVAAVLGSVLLTGCSSSGGSVTDVDAPTFLSTAAQPASRRASGSSVPA